MSDPTTIRGVAAKGYEQLLGLGPAEPGSGGAAAAAYVDDQLVLDGCWGERSTDRPWEADTVCVSMSTAKVVIATAVAALADRDALDVERPVADYWPEFAAAGKGHITVADVLRHRSGTPYPPGYQQVATQDDAELWTHRSRLASLLADGAPTAPPGEIAYGVSTIGLIVDEVVSRATGRSLDLVVQELIADPLGLLLTRTPNDEQLARSADLHLGPSMASPETMARYSRDTLIGKALLAGRLPLDRAVSEVWNSSTRRRVGTWSYAVHSDARSLARVAALLAAGGSLDGVRILAEDTLRRHLRPAAIGNDAVWGGPTQLGLGYSYGDPDDLSFRHTPESFGHHGIGGAVVLADPVRRIGFAFIPSRWDRAPGTDPRAAPIIMSLYQGLA